MSIIDPTKLLISSDFYSVQGEGRTSGVPAYFVRLGLCNLTCGMSSRFLKKLLTEKSLEDGEIFKGDLELEGKATWTCDSTSQWAWRGENRDFRYLIDRWKKEGIYEDILTGVIHIIWTGGEPTMVKHQESIINFINEWGHIENPHESLNSTYHEIETNGTILFSERMFKWMNQINCSPKLSNSGLNEKIRVKPEVIRQIMTHSNYQFKFVISTEEDVKEIFRDFVEPFNIPLKNIICMPGLDSQEDFHERTQFCLEMAKKYKFIGMTRLHISAWDKTLNV